MGYFPLFQFMKKKKNGHNKKLSWMKFCQPKELFTYFINY